MTKSQLNYSLACHDEQFERYLEAIGIPECDYVRYYDYDGINLNVSYELLEKPCCSETVPVVVND